MVGAALACGVATMPSASAQVGPDVGDVGVAVARQVCEQLWLEGVCEAVGHPDPAYRSEEDPSTGPLELRIGAVHEHSGYSDGDPDTRPADYFRAGREGRNEHRDGRDTGVAVDFVLGSEHSDNEKLPVTTAEVCIDLSSIPDGLAALDLEAILPPLRCSNVEHADHYRKWAEALAQAIEATEVDEDGHHVGFTAMRGFEWTNDYYNHLGVYFSRNVVNAKLDGSYLSMDVMWDWLRRPPERGGGADALVVFNHPGGNPALTPFDGDLPHNVLLQELLGGANWDDVAYVPDVDDRVIGIEVNRGDDLAWYVRALSNGWHLGPVAAEDEHERAWSSSDDGKTLVLTRGRSPRDYYHAFHQRRTIALGADLVGGAPGERATFPQLHYWAGAPDRQDPAATPLGGIVDAARTTLRLDLDGLPEGSPVVLVTNAAPEPIALGVVDGSGRLTATHEATAHETEERWWFAVVCPPGTADCGTGESYSAVTAPIWLRPTPIGDEVVDGIPPAGAGAASAASGASAVEAPGPAARGAQPAGEDAAGLAVTAAAHTEAARLPATGGAPLLVLGAVLLVAAGGTWVLRRPA